MNRAPIPDPLLLEIRDLLKELVTVFKDESVFHGTSPRKSRWSKPMTHSEAAARFDVTARTFRTWLKKRGSNGIRHKRVGSLVMIHEDDLPTG